MAIVDSDSTHFLNRVQIKTAYTAWAGGVQNEDLVTYALMLATISTVTSFLALTDTPSAYTGSGGALLQVNSGETALEFGLLVDDVASIDYTAGNVLIGDNSKFVSSDQDSAGIVMKTGNQTVAGIKTFSSFPVTPSSAPTTNYQVSNKKYVDDEITSASSALLASDNTWTGDNEFQGDVSLTGGAKVFTTSVLSVDLQASTSVEIDAGSYFSITADTDSSIGVTDANQDLSLFSSAGSVAINGAEAIASAVGITASDTAGGIDINAGTGGITVDTTGAFSIDGVGASNISLATAGDASDLTISLTGATNSSILLSSTGTGADAIGLSASAGGLNLDGASGVTIDSSAGVISVGADAVVQNINIGTGASARTITVGNNASAEVEVNALIVDVNSGGALTLDGVGISIDGTGASNVTVTGAGADLTLSSVGGSVAIDGSEASASAIGITASDVAGGIDINAGATSGIIDIDAGGAITIDSSAGGVSIDSYDDSNLTMTATDAGDKTLTIASSNAGAGAGLIAISSDGETDLTVGSLDVNSTAGIAIDGTTVSIDGTGASNVTVTGAGADLTLSSVGGSVAIDGSEASATAIGITASDTAGGIDINAGTGGIAVDTTGAFDLNVGAGQDIAMDIADQTTADTAGGDIDITAGKGLGTGKGGAFTMNAGAGGATGNGGAITIEAGVGGATSGTGGYAYVYGGDGTEGDGGNVHVFAGSADGLTDHNGGQISIAGGTAINDGVAGTVGLVGGSADVNGAGGEVSISGGDGGSVTGTAGGVSIEGGFGTSGDGGGIYIAGSDANTAGDGGTIEIVAGNGVGGGSDGEITLDGGVISIDGTGASNVTVTGAGIDLTLSSVGGSVAIDGSEASATAIGITASDVAGGIDINAGTGGITVDTTGAFSIDGVGASNISLATAGDASDLTISLTGATNSSILLSSTGTGADAIGLSASAGGISVTGDVLMATDDKVQFRDSALYLQSSTDGQLDIVSDGKIYNRGNFDCSKYFHFEDFEGGVIGMYWTVASVGTGVAPAITAVVNGVSRFIVNANNDESSMIWTEAIYDNDQNPVFEWRMRSNTQITSQEIEAGFYVNANDYLMFAFRTGTDASNIYLVSNNNAGGEVATDTTVDLTVDTYFVFRLELFADNTFKAYINGTQVASGHAGTIRDVAFLPRVWFKGLAAQVNQLDLDYIKVWQDRE